MSREPELEPPSTSDGWELVPPVGEEGAGAPEEVAGAAPDTPPEGPGDAAGPPEEPAPEREDAADVPAEGSEERPRVSAEHTFDDALLATLAAQLKGPLQGVDPVERVLRAYTAGISFQPLFFDDQSVSAYLPIGIALGNRARCWTAVGFEQFGWTRFRPTSLRWAGLGLIITPWASQAEAEAFAYGLRAETHHRLAFRLAEESLRNVFV